MRDELSNWLSARLRPYNPDASFMVHYNDGISTFVRKAENMACKIEREQVRPTMLVAQTSILI